MKNVERIERATKRRDQAKMMLEISEDEYAGASEVYKSNFRLLGNNPESVLERARSNVKYWTKEYHIWNAALILLEKD